MALTSLRRYVRHFRTAAWVLPAVRFLLFPESDLLLRGNEMRRRATTRLMRRNKMSYSITSSARARRRD
jgi:hypothetical protein